MYRIALAALFACLAAPCLVRPALAQTEQQSLVDRATLSAQEMLNDTDGRDAQYMLRHARAVLICPRIFRAGFLLGGQGGGCVLTGKDDQGRWSAPAFYGLGGASFGFQAGMQDMSVMMFVMNTNGLMALMDSQFKIGADAGATFVEWGGGVEGATTAALRADIVSFSRARGLFAGISLGGSLISARTDWNQAYYGRLFAAQQIVMGGEGANQGADPLREVLGRISRTSEAPIPLASAAPAPQYQTPPYQRAPSPYAPAPATGRGSVQATPLAPPSR
jgi:lipid-binding SYLF domain-containing protein